MALPPRDPNVETKPFPELGKVQLLDEPPKETTEPPKVKKYRGTALKPGLEKFYTNIGLMVFAFDQPCGSAIITQAEKTAAALDDLAKENEAVRRVLLKMVETSVWGNVIAAHIPILASVVVHHNLPGSEIIQQVVGGQEEKAA